ncbi:hypothetical protein JTB14_001902 [Gonioctena quinquepunctata]|nr:hypothetical protein JTB14_001902 [Gonioctena quinquepunctata]
MSNSNYNNDTKPRTENSASISKDAFDPNTERVTTTRLDMTTKVLLRVVNVRLYGQNSFIDTVALSDEASTVTLVDESIVAELGIEGHRQPSTNLTKNFWMLQRCQNIHPGKCSFRQRLIASISDYHEGRLDEI